MKRLLCAAAFLVSAVSPAAGRQIFPDNPARTVNGWEGTIRVVYEDTLAYAPPESYHRTGIAEGGFRIMDNLQMPAGMELHTAWPRPSIAASMSPEALAAEVNTWDATYQFEFEEKTVMEGGMHTRSCQQSGNVKGRVGISMVSSTELGLGVFLDVADIPCTGNLLGDANEKMHWSVAVDTGTVRIPVTGGLHLAGSHTTPEGYTIHWDVSPIRR